MMMIKQLKLDLSSYNLDDLSKYQNILADSISSLKKAKYNLEDALIINGLLTLLEDFNYQITTQYKEQTRNLNE